MSAGPHPGQHHSRAAHYQEASDLLAMAVTALRQGAGDDLAARRHNELVARANVHAMLATAPADVEVAARATRRPPVELPAPDPRAQHGVHCPAAYSAGACTYTDGCVVKFIPSAFPGVPPIRRYANGVEEYGPYTPPAGPYTPPAGSGWPGSDATIWAVNDAHADAIKAAHPRAADRVKVLLPACGETTPDGPCNLTAGHPSYPGAPGHNGHMADVPPPPDAPLPVDELEDQGSPDLSLAALDQISRAMHDMVASWSTGQRTEHEALQHGSHMRGEECWLNFHLEDVHRLIDDAVRELAHNPAGPSIGRISENATLRQHLADALHQLDRTAANRRQLGRGPVSVQSTGEPSRRMLAVLAAADEGGTFATAVRDRLSRADIRLPDPTPQED